MYRRPYSRSFSQWGLLLLFLIGGGKRRIGLSRVSASWATRPSRESGVAGAAALDLSSADSSSSPLVSRRQRPRSSRNGDEPRRKRRRKRSNSSRTSSSENLWDDEFMPLVFSEDEREEEVVSALAKVEEEEDGAQDKHGMMRPRKMLYESSQSQDSNDALEESSDVSSQVRSVAETKRNRKSAQEEKRPVKAQREQNSQFQPRHQSAPPSVREKPMPEKSVPANTLSTVQNSRGWTSHKATDRNINSASPSGNLAQATSPTGSTGGATNLVPPSKPAFVSSNSVRHSNPALPTTPASLNRSHYIQASRTAAHSASIPKSVWTPTTTYSQPAVSQSPPTLLQHASSSSTTTITPWVRRFLSSTSRDALLPIPRSYLSDGFNLVQLAPIVERVARTTSSEGGYVSQATAHKQSSSSFPYYKAALRLILQEDENAPAPVPAVQRAAEALYLLVHARYVISPRGLDTVRRVMKRELSQVDPVFGRCPRFGCRGMPLLPYGESDDFDLSASPTSRSKRYCCCCGEKLFMWDSKVDGCAWGPSFCHLFLMTYGEDVFPGLVRIHDAEMAADETSIRVVTPSIFGFELHPSCKARYPRRVESNQ